MLPTIQAAADHAAAQSDRWLFIATLIVFAVVMVWVARYFVNKHESMQKDHREERLSLQGELRADREKYQASLREVVGQQNQTVQSLAVVLERNTDALKCCTDELRFLRGEKH
jgi:type VI protein secretion system component VasK